MVGTFSVKMSHWPLSGTPITHITPAQVSRFPMWVCLGLFFVRRSWCNRSALFHGGHISTGGNDGGDGRQVALKQMAFCLAESKTITVVKITIGTLSSKNFWLIQWKNGYIYIMDWHKFWMKPDFSSSTFIRLTFVFFSEMSLQL